MSRPAGLPPIEDMPEILSVEQAARYLNLGRRTAYRRHSEGTLPGAERIGPRRVVRKRALVRWFEGGDAA